MQLPQWLRASPWLSRRESSAVERWVVLDVETTGLDASSASLLAVAAVGVEVDLAAGQCALVLNDGFERLVQPEHSSDDEANVLLHGIGRGAQARAEPAATVLHDLRAYLGSSPLLAFHAGFDAALLRRACKRAAQPLLPNPWLDLAALCRVLWPEQPHLHALDDWLGLFELECKLRHQAACDAWAEAELLQVIWPRLGVQCRSFFQAQRLSQQARWLAS